MSYVEFLMEVDKLGLNTSLATSSGQHGSLIAKIEKGIVRISNRGRDGKLIVAVNIEQDRILNFVLSKFGFNVNTVKFWKNSKTVIERSFDNVKRSSSQGKQKELLEAMDNIIKIIDKQIGSLQVQ